MEQQTCMPQCVISLLKRFIHSVVERIQYFSLICHHSSLFVVIIPVAVSLNCQTSLMCRP